MKGYKGIFVLWIIAVLLLAGCRAERDVTGDLYDQKTDLSETEAVVTEETAPQDKNGDDAEEAEAVEAVEELSEEELLAEAIAIRDEKDAQNKAEDGEFYVPLPTIESLDDLDKEPIDVEAKGLYMTANIAGFKFDEANIDLYSRYINYISGNADEVVTAEQVDGVNRLEQILAICNTTEVNALVIDVKNDDGYVKWDSDIEFVNRINSDVSAPFKDYEPLMNYLKAHDIYAIARVVCFKDSFCAEAEPDHTIQLKAGGVYRDRKGIAWVNPYDPYIWDYLVAVSKEAANRGFDEIQFDYVRFPANAKSYNPITTYPHQEGRTKDEAIEAFLIYANEQLADYNVHIAVDVFAQLTRSWDDHPEDIGQTWRKMALQSDYICPMIYPSHYGPGVYGYDVPDQHPFGVIHRAMGEALERNSAQENPAEIRAWIQGFNAPWIKGYIDYDAVTTAEQIKAIRDYGIQEYIIWDPKNTYDPMIFFYALDTPATLPNKDMDVTGRSAEEALDRFLTAEKYDRTSQLYLLLMKDQREGDYDDFVVAYEASAIDVTGYAIDSVSYSGEVDGVYTFEAVVDIEFTNANGQISLTDQAYNIQMEDGVFKIIGPDKATAMPTVEELEEAESDDA